MAIPRIFISSTCYDLKYIRENLNYFIKTLGYVPILSEEGSVFFNPKQHAQDACLAEVPNCQVFVLIIGGRFGAKYKGQDLSVTNAEYREAVRLKIPIFTLVEQAVFNEYYVYQRNNANKDIDKTKIIYPSSDSTKIFDFIDEVRMGSVNNAVVPFKDFSDIEDYLRRQWAAMLFYFLTADNEEKRVTDTLMMLTLMNERIEMLSKQILNSVGTPHAKITVEMYDKMLNYECIRDAGYFNLKPTPASILTNTSFLDWVKLLGKEINVKPSKDGEGPQDFISSDDSMSDVHHVKSEKTFQLLKEELLKILKSYNMTLEEYLKQNHELKG